jgi:hypothetical protein
MKKVITILVLTCMMLMVGCVTLTPTYSTLPANATSEQKAEALQQDMVTHLKDPAFQAGVKTALVVAGKIVMQKATSEGDREAIANQMWAWSSAFYSVANGTSVTVSQVDATMKSFTTSATANQYTSFIDAANVAWAMVYPELKSLDDSTLWVQWLNVFAGAAQEVAKAYATIDPTAPITPPAQ